MTTDLSRHRPTAKLRRNRFGCPVSDFVEKARIPGFDFIPERCSLSLGDGHIAGGRSCAGFLESVDGDLGETGLA